MTLIRHWMIVVFAGCALGTHALLAQDASGSGGSSSGGNASGGSSSGSNSSGSGGQGNSSPGNSSPGSSPFDFGPGSGAPGLPTLPTLPGAPGAPGSGPGSGASSGFGLPGMPGTGTGGPGSSPGQGNQFGQPAAPGAPGSSAAPASFFGFPALPTEPTSPSTNAPVMPATSLPVVPAATTFGSGTGGAQIPSAAAATFTVPGFYGAGPQTFTVGQGRLARPHFQYTGSIQTGFDDNVLSSPTNGLGAAPAFETILLQPAVATTQHVIEVLLPGVKAAEKGQLGLRPAILRHPFRTEVVTTPGHAAVLGKKLVFPGAPAPKRIASFVARANVGYQIQFASRRTIFTLDLNLTDNYLANRPRSQSDYTGSLASTLVYKISSRMQFSATLSAAYLTQPNLSVINAPTRYVGNYLTENFKADLSYSWTRRFSTVMSITTNQISYQMQTERGADYLAIGGGVETRYLFSPLLTLVGEVRYQETTAPYNRGLDSTSLYYLAGAELTLSRRVTASLRVGESDGRYSSGSTFQTPYMELSTGWRYSPTGVLSLTSHYGFEQPPGINETLQVFRLGLNLSHAITSRLRLTIGVAGANRVTNYTVSHASTTERNLDFNLGLQYTLTPHITLTANYDLLEDLNTIPGSNYYRNQSFLGAQYTF